MRAASSASQINLNALAKQAGFPDNFDLALHAKSVMAAFLYVRTVELLDREIRSHRDQLRRLVVNSEGVIEALRSLDPAVIDAAIAPETDLTPDALANLASQLSLLSTATRTLISEIAPGQKGRKAEAGLDFAIQALYGVFRDHFPDEVGVYRKDEADFGYAGRFYELVRLLLDAIGIEKSPHGLGKAILRSLKMPSV